MDPSGPTAGNDKNKLTTKTKSFPYFPLTIPLQSIMRRSSSIGDSPTCGDLMNIERGSSPSSGSSQGTGSVAEDPNDAPPSVQGASPGCQAAYDKVVKDFQHIMTGLSSRKKAAFNVILELLSSERTYIDNINVVAVEFSNEVMAAKNGDGSPVISEKEETIGILKVLKELNENFLSDLEERIPNWDRNSKIGDLCLKRFPGFVFYAIYIKELNERMGKLSKLRDERPQFAAVLQHFLERKRVNGMDFYMLAPLQRMTKYELLFGNYLKSLVEVDEDYADTEKVIEMIKGVPGHVNESITADELYDLQNRVRLDPDQTFFTPKRHLIKMGELEKRCQKGEKILPRLFALATDCLLYFRPLVPAVGQHDLEPAFLSPLDKTRVFINPAEDCQTKLSVISVTKSFELNAKTPKERDEWMKAFEEAFRKAEIKPEAPIWTPDEDVTMCQACVVVFAQSTLNIFDIITNRRHHCRSCGEVVCKGCSTEKLPLSYARNSNERVCDRCGVRILNAIVPQEEDIALPTITSILRWKEEGDKQFKKRGKLELVENILQIYAAPMDIRPMLSIPIEEQVEGGTRQRLQMVRQYPKPPSEFDKGLGIFRILDLGTKKKPIFVEIPNKVTVEKWKNVLTG